VQIARHRALDRLRRNRSGFRALETQENGEQMADPAPAVEQQVLQAQDACRLQRCLEHLTERQRECLQLAYFEGLSHAELAERLGVPLGSVKTWIRRGLIQLKECIET
jgi:RNA polymerase sigma-70 factor (ECF subfamily)